MMDFIANNLTDIIGYTASICLILGYMPQAIYTIRTHDTDGIALPTFLMMGIGSSAFMLQGLLHDPDIIWSLFITNLITTICSCIVFGIKVYKAKELKEMLSVYRELASSHVEPRVKAAFANRYFFLNQYRRLQFYFDYVI